jgi:hypothetical protein
MGPRPLPPSGVPFWGNPSGTTLGSSQPSFIVPAPRPRGFPSFPGILKALPDRLGAVPGRDRGSGQPTKPPTRAARSHPPEGYQGVGVTMGSHGFAYSCVGVLSHRQVARPFSFELFLRPEDAAHRSPERNQTLPRSLLVLSGPPAHDGLFLVLRGVPGQPCCGPRLTGLPRIPTVNPPGTPTPLEALGRSRSRAFPTMHSATPLAFDCRRAARMPLARTRSAEGVHGVHRFHRIALEYLV